MSEPPPGFIRTPNPLAAALIALSVLPLPTGSRDRWSDEYRAEIFGLPRTRQIMNAASVLAGALTLRSALKAGDSESVFAAATSWSCRLGRHQFRSVNQDNPENRQYQYRECVTCGNLKEGPSADFSRTDRPFMGGGGLAN